MQIKLSKMTFYAFHGVLEQERRVGNTFYVDVTIELDMVKGAMTDEIYDTISYKDVYDLIAKEMKYPSNLLEHVTYRILEVLMSVYPEIKHCIVSVAKQNPPMGGDIDCATIVMDSNDLSVK